MYEYFFEDIIAPTKQQQEAIRIRKAFGGEDQDVLEARIKAGLVYM